MVFVLFRLNPSKILKLVSWDLSPDRLDLEAIILNHCTYSLSQKNKQIFTAIFENCVFDT